MSIIIVVERCHRFRSSEKCSPWSVSCQLMQMLYCIRLVIASCLWNAVCLSVWMDGWWDFGLGIWLGLCEKQEVIIFCARFSIESSRFSSLHKCREMLWTKAKFARNYQYLQLRSHRFRICAASMTLGRKCWAKSCLRVISIVKKGGSSKQVLAKWQHCRLLMTLHQCNVM